MEFLISKWIRECIAEYEKAKENQNVFQMRQMQRLNRALLDLRDKLLKPQ
jgi:hypothetical protein